MSQWKCWKSDARSSVFSKKKKDSSPVLYNVNERNHHKYLQQYLVIFGATFSLMLRFSSLKLSWTAKQFVTSYHGKTPASHELCRGQTTSGIAKFYGELQLKFRGQNGGIFLQWVNGWISAMKNIWGLGHFEEPTHYRRFSRDVIAAMLVWRKQTTPGDEVGKQKIFH